MLIFWATNCENNLSPFHPLVHSASSDRRWAIRVVAARIDFVFVLSERSKADFPADAQRRQLKRQRALASEPSLSRLRAFQDGSLQEEAWGPWEAEAAPISEPVLPAEPVLLEESESLMASRNAFA